MKNLTASDRSALIKLASSLPQGDETRKAILSGLKSAAYSFDKTPATATAADVLKMRAAVILATGQAEVEEGYRREAAKIQRFVYMEADPNSSRAGQYHFFAIVNDPYSYAKPDLGRDRGGFRTEYCYACSAYGKVGGNPKGVLLTKESVPFGDAQEVIQTKARQKKRSEYRVLSLPNVNSLNEIRII